MGKPVHLSYSSVELYRNCAERWKLQYLDGHREEPGEPLIVGSAVHEAMEEWGRARLHGARLTLADPELELALWTKQIHAKTKAERQRYYDRARRLTGAMLDVLTGVDFVPSAVEQHFEFPLCDGWTFTGFIDAISAGTGRLLDWKTANKPWWPKREHTTAQVEAYYAGYRHLYGTLPTGGFTFVVISDAGGAAEPTVELRPTDRTEAQVEAFLDLARECATAIDAGRFRPNPAYRFCDWCPWKQPKTLRCSAFKPEVRA